MNESRAREEICRIGKSLFKRGYAHATAGNISVRLDDGFLITPTDACLGFLDPAQLARLDAGGRHLAGERASKTLALHTAIYDAALPFDAGTRCIIHTHSTHSVALSLRCKDAELLPPVTPYFVMKVGHVPLVPYRRPGDRAAAQDVAALVRKYGEQGRAIRAVMLQRLGPNAWHDTPGAAMAVLEEVEETARLVLLAQGPCPVLDEPQIDELRRAFGARW
jgi:ribulose-5-phosphate 4-epimerase/fuculose-1-phosphate aldolase